MILLEEIHPKLMGVGHVKYSPFLFGYFGVDKIECKMEPRLLIQYRQFSHLIPID